MKENRKGRRKKEMEMEMEMEREKGSVREFCRLENNNNNKKSKTRELPYGILAYYIKDPQLRLPYELN